MTDKKRRKQDKKQQAEHMGDNRVLPNNQIADEWEGEDLYIPASVLAKTKNDELAALSEGTAKGLSDKLNKLEWLSAYLEKMRLADYVTIMSKPKRLIWVNFISGVARGLGFTVGFTLLGALIIYLFNQLKILNLPLIGDFISKLLEYINMRGTRI